jgi:hypothetical protein
VDTQGHWAQVSIQALAVQKVITGFPDGTFRPNDPVTCAQFAVIVAKAFSPAPKRTGTAFADAAKVLVRCDSKPHHRGIHGSYPGGTFKPEQKIL